MTMHATHRFSVGQLVCFAGDRPHACTVATLVGGRDAPAYEVVFAGGHREVVGERDLTYQTGVRLSGSALGSAGTGPAPRSVHSCP